MRLLNASGCLDALTAPGAVRELDAFVTKTVTPLAREGNPPVRIAETEVGMLNAIGLANPGIDAFVAEHLPRLAHLGLPVWVSVGGFSIDDYLLVSARLDGRAEVAGLELNLSCPNVDEVPENVGEVVSAVRAVTGKPLYAKLSPASSDIGELARAVAEAGADGLTLVNTLRGLTLDPDSLRPRLGLASGGASGPALRPIALACVYACANAVDLPIVGMGGVMSGRDAVDLVAAGASAIALGTVLFADPSAPDRVRAELRSEARSRGYASAAEIRGVAHGSTLLSGTSAKQAT